MKRKPIVRTHSILTPDATVSFLHEPREEPRFRKTDIRLNSVLDLLERGGGFPLDASRIGFSIKYRALRHLIDAMPDTMHPV